MSWLVRYKIHRYIVTAIWIPPMLMMLAAMVFAPLVRRFDDHFQWKLFGLTVEGSHLLLAALANSTLSFLVFMFTILLVAIQFASGTLTPRLVATTLNDRNIKRALGIFVFSFCWSAALLARVNERVPQFAMLIAVVSSMLSIVAFLLLLDHIGKTLRPATLISRAAEYGRTIIGSVYPQTLSEAANGRKSYPPPKDNAATQLFPRRGPSGVVVAVDIQGLVEIAMKADCVIELVPQVGDFVATGEPLFRVHGTPGCLTAGPLRRSIVIGPERTIQQDPAFIFRIIVDVALKALSPAINDPTTAVTAIDQLHRLLAQAGKRHLNNGEVTDSTGQVRVQFRTPNWENFVQLSITEIRHFGQTSIQALRRLRAMIDSLMKTLPESRTPALAIELELIQQAVRRQFPDAEDRRTADVADTQGLGGAPVFERSESITP